MKKMNICYNSKHFLNVLLLIVALLDINTNAWAWRGARVYVKSQPEIGGLVDVSTGSADGYSTSEKAEKSEGGLRDTYFTFYLYQKANDGYAFKGWSTDRNSTSGFTDTNVSVKASGASISYNEYTYYAIFSPISYKIAFDGNGATSGTMSNMSMTYATAKALTANAFSRVYTVNYDANGGTSTSSSAIVTYTFAGWEDRNSIVYNGTTYAYTTFDAPYYANTYGDLYAAFGYNKYNLIQHYVNYGKGEGRSCKGATSGLYPNKATVNNLTTTADATVTLYAHWDCENPSITLPAATKSGAVIEGWYNGETLVGLPGDTYTPTSSVTLTAHWINKYNITVTGSDRTLDVDEVLENAFTFVHAENPTAHISDESIFTYNAVANTITAKKVGTATIYFSQSETGTMFEGDTDPWTITVKRVDNTLRIASSSYTKYVDQECTSVISGKNSTATLQTSSSDATIAYYDINSNKIVIPNSEAKSFNTKDISIRIWQDQTPKYEGFDQTIVVTVSKYTPTFTWNSTDKTYYYQSTIPSIFSTTGPNAYTIVSDNEPSAKVVDNTLHIYNVEETANITVTQEENYLWAGKTATYVVTPVELNNHVEFRLNSSARRDALYYGKSSNGAISCVNDGTIELSQNGGAAVWTANPLYYDVKFAGIPDKVSFTYSQSMATSTALGETGKAFIVYWSEDDGTGKPKSWNELWTSNGVKGDKNDHDVNNLQLAPSVRFLRFFFDATYTGYYKNIHVTELNQFSASPVRVDFGTKGTNFGTQEENVTFNHANAGRVTTMEIVGADAEFFSIERSSIPGTGRDLYSTFTIAVRFDNKGEVRGEAPYNAVLHIVDNAGHELNIPLTGIRNGKTSPEFSFNPNHLPYFVGTNIANVASSTNTDYANCPLTFETNDASVAQVIDGTLHIYNKQQPVTITVRQGENEDYAAGSATFTFTPRERPDRSVPMQLVKTIYNEGTVEAGNKCAWDDAEGGVRVGNTNIVVDDLIWEHAEKNFTIAFDGQPGRLSFEYKSAGGIWVVTGGDTFGFHMWEVKESSDGSTWKSVWTAEEAQKEWTSVNEIPLSPTTRYIRFSFSGNYWGYFRNINISELVGYKYLRAEADGRYLSRGAKWGTQAIVDDFGMACRISNYTNDNTNFYTRFLFVDNQQYLYEADNHEMYTDDGTAANNYNLWKQNVIDGTILTFQSGNEYPGDSRKGQYITLDGDALALTAEAAAATRWKMEDYTEHPAHILEILNREAAEAASHDFATDVTTLEKVRSRVEENDFERTDITIPALTLGEQSGEYRSGVAGTNAIYDNEISGLQPGFYRLTVKAFSRISSADVAWACHTAGAGMESVLAYIYANDVKYPIQSLYHSYQVSPLEPTDELRDGYYYSTDLTSAGDAFDDAKRYLNDVYVYIEADPGKTTGTLRYGIKNPSYVPGAWLAFEEITLTRFARKEYIFNGESTTGETTDWQMGGNWNRNTQPDYRHVVSVQHDLVIDEEVSVYSLVIENDKYGNPVTVTIAPTGGLTVGARGVKNATKDNFILQAGTTGATKGQTGYLRISPYTREPMPEATVQLFSIGYCDYQLGLTNPAAWQYVGSPVVAGTKAKSVFFGWIYDWKETTGEWKNNRKNLILEPFKGYATTQDFFEDGLLISQAGQLVSNETVQIPLAYTSTSEEAGFNVIANSFTAPIDITRFEDADFQNMEKTIYLFNTGSREDAEAVTARRAAGNNAPGQYISIPIGATKLMKSAFGEETLPTVIPSMQGFCVRATGEDAKIKLDYNKLVWEGKYAVNSNTPLRVIAAETELTGALQVTLRTGEWSDHMYMMESENFDYVYEDGFDAHKVMNGMLNVFAVEDEDYLAVNATNSIDGTHIGVRTGEEMTYTMTFSHINSEENWMLWDKEAGFKMLLSEDVEYTFNAAPNSEITERFQIIAADIPAIATGVDKVESEVHVQKFIKDNQLYILKDGVLYNASGAVVRK